MNVSLCYASYYFTGATHNAMCIVHPASGGKFQVNHCCSVFLFESPHEITMKAYLGTVQNYALSSAAQYSKIMIQPRMCTQRWIPLAISIFKND